MPDTQCHQAVLAPWLGCGLLHRALPSQPDSSDSLQKLFCLPLGPLPAFSTLSASWEVGLEGLPSSQHLGRERRPPVDSPQRLCLPSPSVWGPR